MEPSRELVELFSDPADLLKVFVESLKEEISLLVKNKDDIIVAPAISNRRYFQVCFRL
tara:strand:- start:475 stop:648 length:174 start_codon:yes stop_codon:yes gene_type:complete